MEFDLNFLDQISFNTAPDPLHEEYNPNHRAPQSELRVIAFYLPQFHAIPENDHWWGKGFTEWTNVTKALPRYVGHYQPQLPSDLGFYDLTNAETLKLQADLARQYGVEGFCFHHYWFNGRRLLEKPIDLLLSRPDIDLPFCINWANESWSRRWDGNDKNVLMEQHHSPEDDIAFARSMEPFFRDARYIRISGRPLLMLYRPALLPDAKQTVSRWRDYFQAAGLGNPFVVMAQSFGDRDPDRYGMDAAAGFPPFWGIDRLPRRDDLELLDPNFKGTVHSYDAMIAANVSAWSANNRVFPGVCPAWDNEARKPGRGHSFSGSTPAKYQDWLERACKQSIATFPAGERLVFVNAWNEWAEGAHLEPDRHFGYAYLAANARALQRFAERTEASAPIERAEPTFAPPPPRRTLKRRARRLARVSLNRAAGLLEDTAWWLRGN